MDTRYKNQVDECGLFGEGNCEICGKRGYHEVCAARVLQIERQFLENHVRLLQQHAVHGALGAAGPQSQASLDRAVAALTAYLKRPLECDLGNAIEGDSWWFIPEGWIGMIGFIVEKRSSTIYALGSGLVAWSKLQYTNSDWCGILSYLNGKVDAVDS
ncbi:hypothetical protein F2P44_13085 [Massilia sp. CCM 8695]|uniref:Uncharacterized protein n=1 Tax=Massilia frigida TaxID=2609281 RepID=A0ABX0N582_9BURK|nr:hypothetical protein [Massilia frigida]NHZ80202.1 hypothetical protein [Massilia frigida]